MRITFLGTGTSQGVPVIGCKCNVCKSTDIKDKRLRSSILVETKDITLIIDAGPDFRQQLLRQNVDKLDAILLTHEHKDHIGGLDDVRAFNFMTKRPMDIYALKRVNDNIKHDFSYVFSDEKYPGIPEMNLHNIEFYKKFSINGLKIVPLKVMHFHLSIAAFRINNFTYITDTSSIPDETLTHIKGSTHIIINALRKEKHYSHFNVKEALEIINKLKPQKAYLNHISHLMGKHKDVSKELPDNVVLAYDGLSFDI